jgi:hypothetical protein
MHNIWWNKKESRYKLNQSSHAEESEGEASAWKLIASFEAYNFTDLMEFFTNLTNLNTENQVVLNDVEKL